MSDEEIDYSDDLSSTSDVRSLPMQQNLDAAEGRHSETSFVSHNDADSRISRDVGSDEAWAPDFAAQWDYVLVIPDAGDDDKNLPNKYTDKMLAFGMEMHCYKGEGDVVIMLVRAPLPLLRSYADDTNFQMKLDPDELTKICKAGIPEHGITPITIPHNPDVCKYHPTDHIYAKYSMGCPEELFYRPPELRNQGHPFGPKERLRLVSTLMEARPKWGGENLKFGRYLANKTLLGYFPLHNPEELRVLSKYWNQWGVMPWDQPFHAIKEYFGEKLGLYFLFMGHYTTYLVLPAVIGAIMQVWNLYYYDTLRGAFNSKALPFFSVFIVIWAIAMLEAWKRKEARTSLEWGTNKFEENETDSSEFRAKFSESYVTGKQVRYFSEKERRKMINQSTLVVFTMICIVIAVVASIYIIRSYLVDHGTATGDAQTIASIINAIEIQLANAGYNLLATELTKRENHRTTTDYENSLTSKIFAFQFINSYASFFYIAFFASHVEDEGCGPNGCMFSLGKNLAIIFITRLLSGNFIELMYPVLCNLYNRCFKCTCCNAICNCCCKAKDQKNFSRPEVEYSMSRVDTSAQVVSDYTEVAIQFGYQALFVCALPASSMFALISNIFEVKGDAWKLMNLYQRPVPVVGESIGVFHDIFRIIVGASVVSNAALMKFTLTVLNDFDQTTQWFIFTGFQWVMFGIMVVMDQAIEDVPEDVKMQIDRNEYLEHKLIDHAADEPILMDKRPPIVKPEFKKYPHFGSKITFTPSEGYKSETASRSASMASFCTGDRSTAHDIANALGASNPITEALMDERE